MPGIHSSKKVWYVICISGFLNIYLFTVVRYVNSYNVLVYLLIFIISHIDNEHRY